MIYLLINFILGFIAAGWIRAKYERRFNEVVATYKIVDETITVQRVASNKTMIACILLGIVTFIFGLLLCIESKSFKWQFPFRKE